MWRVGWRGAGPSRNSALLCSQDTTHCGFTSPPAYATTLLSSAHPGAAATRWLLLRLAALPCSCDSTLHELGLLRAFPIYGFGLNWVGQTGNRTGSTLRGRAGWRHGATHSRGVWPDCAQAHVSGAQWLLHRCRQQPEQADPRAAAEHAHTRATFHISPSRCCNQLCVGWWRSAPTPCTVQAVALTCAYWWHQM